MIWMESDVEVPHRSTAVAVITGWVASLPRVENHAVTDSPVPMKPWVLAVHRISKGSPLGSSAVADTVR